MAAMETWFTDSRRPQLPTEWNGTTQRPQRIRRSAVTDGIADLIQSLGRERAAGPAAAHKRGMQLTLTMCPPEPSERIADTPISLATIFEKEEWFADDGPAPTSLELYAHFQESSTLDQLAFYHYTDLNNQGKGGKMAPTLFVTRRNRAREVYAKRVCEIPDLAFVDWSNLECGGESEGFQRNRETPASFSRVNLGSFSPEDLWISYERFNASKPVPEHWERVKDVGVAKEKLEFFDRVKAARSFKRRLGTPGRTRRKSRRASMAEYPATLLIPICHRDVLAFPGGALTLHRLCTTKAMASSKHTASPGTTTLEREATRSVVNSVDNRLAMIGNWLAEAEKKNLFSEFPCVRGEFSVAPVHFSDDMPMEILVVDADGVVLRRSTVNRCGLAGTAFSVPGAYAFTQDSRKRVKGTPAMREETASGLSRSARRRSKAYRGNPADLEAAEARAAVCARVSFYQSALPLVARGEPGTFSGISFDDEIGKKPRTKAFTHKTRPVRSSWHFWPHIMGPMVDYGGSVSARLGPFLKKRGTEKNMTRLNKVDLVRGMQQAQEYLLQRRDLRRECVNPLLSEITGLLGAFKQTGKLKNKRHAVVRIIKAVDKIRDPHAQRDQSTSGPQALREQAAMAHMERSLLAEASALGVPRVKVPPPDMHRVFGWTYLQTQSFATSCAALDEPVKIEIQGVGIVVESAALAEGSAERRGAGFAAMLLQRACDASLHSEILRRSLETPLADEDPTETERAKQRIYASTNLLRTVLSNRAYTALSRQLAFFDFG